jgi:uncharacterized protein (DUF488 family)
MDSIGPERQPHLFTVGHSNHPLETFVALLQKHKVQVLADIRSSPYSRYVKHFDREELEQSLQQADIEYLYLGKELGGRPDEDEFYDAEGLVLYYRLAESATFLEGIHRLEQGIQRYRVAIMCSEENPAVCHRYLLVGRVVTRRGVKLSHIRGDGSLLPDSELREEDFVQPTLFDGPEDSPWKSLRSVLRRKTPSSSSDSSARMESSDSSTCD